MEEDNVNGKEAAQGHEITYISQEEAKVIEQEDDALPSNSKRTSGRRDHLQSLILTNKAIMKYSNMKLEILETEAGSSLQDSAMEDEARSKVQERLKFVTQKKVEKTKYSFPIEVRMNGLTFQAQVDPASQKIKTVYNSSILYKIGQW